MNQTAIQWRMNTSTQGEAVRSSFCRVLVARKLTAAHAPFDLLQEKPVAFKWSHDHTLARMESHPLCFLGFVTK